MGFEGSLRRVLFGRKPVESLAEVGLHPAMVTELQRLDLLSPRLGQTAIRYVASGERGDVIDAVRAAKAKASYDSPYQQSGPMNDVEYASNLAFVRGEIPPGPDVARFLSVRLATGRISMPYGVAPTPAGALLMAFTAMVNGGVHQRAEQNRVPWELIIPVKTLFAHFRQIGGTMSDLFKMIMGYGHFLVAESWSTTTEFKDYATTYPAAFAEAMSKVGSGARAQAIKLAESLGVTALPEVEAALVAMLVRPFDKTDRERATSALARLDPTQLLALLTRELPRADIDTRHGLVQAAGRNGAAELLTLLAERAKVEKAGKVKAAIDAVLETGAADDRLIDAGGEQGSGYTAIDGSFLAIPPRKDLGADAIVRPSAACRDELLRLIGEVESYFRDAFAKSDTRHSREWTGYTPEEIETTFAVFTEGKSVPTHLRCPTDPLLSREEGKAWFREFIATQSPRATLRILHGVCDWNSPTWLGLEHQPRGAKGFGSHLIREWTAQGLIDVRDLTDARQLGLLLVRPRSWWEGPEFMGIGELPAEAVWPWIADNLDVMDQALGLKPSQTPVPLDRALMALGFLPKVPQRYFTRLLEVAVAEKRPLRRKAMALLRDAKDLAKRIEALLDDARQPVRVNAAGWLADIRSTASEGAMRKRLKKEKSDPVRAALIESLQRLGFDLSDVIGPASLIAEAQVATAKSAPSLPDWLVGFGLPPVRFCDGATLPPAVVEHWLALAIKLKDPGASGQFGIYLDQLDPADAEAFSNWVLESWIAYDTQSCSLDEATAYALANYQQHYHWAYRASPSPQHRDEAIAMMIREKTGEVINSGSSTRGMLALACRAEPVWAANRVRWFLKKHGRRSNQAMALLEVLVGIGAPAALQVVIAASARLKQKSTQARAAEIAERYAEDRGWSFDELADRTVPTAGFDDDGVLELPCGEDGKVYVARLDAMLAIHLFNPEGKPVKAVPAGDDEATRESKKAFSTARKELAQVIDLQAARLFEAMCVERAWAVADWRLAFHEHPVMRRLIERLVWQGLDAEGAPLALFRPTQEGDFTGADDAAVDLAGFAKVRLAHGALVDEATCQAWTAHLKDYEVTPFLAQFDTLRAPLSVEQGEAETIFDRQGWKADSRTLRGVAEKRGYERVMGDGGGCNEYAKTFASHGVTATIFHTGSHAVDENNPVALKELRFAKRDHRGAYRLKDVPPIMLAECWADYHAIAAKGAFDPEWEKVSPW